MIKYPKVNGVRICYPDAHSQMPKQAKADGYLAEDIVF
jgi:hypothetical protein